MNTKAHWWKYAVVVLALSLTACTSKKSYTAMFEMENELYQRTAELNHLKVVNRQLQNALTNEKSISSQLRNIVDAHDKKLQNMKQAIANRDVELQRRKEAILMQGEELPQRQQIILRQEEVIGRQNEIIARRDRELAELRMQLDDINAELRMTAERVGELQEIVDTSSDKDHLLAPDTIQEECFTQVLIPARMEAVTEKVLVQAASERIEIIPAQYETVEEKVLVKEASQRPEVTPATYETITEQVLVKEAHSVWKKGTGPIQRIDEATGEIMYLTEIPAEYKTVTKRVIKSPATIHMVEVPAEYKTVTETKLVNPAREQKVAVPAKYKTINKQVVVEPEHMELRPILCQTNMTADKISKIQAALAKAGYDPGPIDGMIGNGTIEAANSFQKDKKLLVCDYMTMETLEALGVR